MSRSELAVLFTTITASGGKAQIFDDDYNVRAGDGYSGGGGEGETSNSGGSDGSDGGGSNGGKGSGVNITKYALSKFNLSPGNGGQSQPWDYGLFSGGGGGGVLVDGEGPTNSEYQGEGYGGGGGGEPEGDVIPGLPGVVLVEVVEV